ncbi:MAG: ester cyclase [Dehalococcoidales bacterium]
MSEEENKMIIRHLNEALNVKVLSAVHELVAENYILHTTSGPDIGLEGYRQYLETVQAIYPDLHITIDDMIANEDKVAHRFTWRGTHQGGWAGIRPTGKLVTVKAIAFSRFENGKIAEEWTIHDRLGLYQQLGVVPSIQELGR